MDQDTATRADQRLLLRGEERTRGFRQFCVHYKGMWGKERCEAGHAFADVAAQRDGRKHYPCFQFDHGATLGGYIPMADPLPCADCRFPTIAEAEARYDQALAAFLQRARDIDAGICPNHQRPMTLRQIGRCVYAEPCGCRLYQGRLRRDQQSDSGAQP